MINVTGFNDVVNILNFIVQAIVAILAWVTIIITKGSVREQLKLNLK